MIDRKREIYIKIIKVKEIVDLLTVIQEKEKKLNDLFNHTDKLSSMESKTLENWASYLEDTNQKLDHVTL